MGNDLRALIHLDLDAFFAAVEVLENPALAGRPVVVGGRAEERGVIAAASYPARVFGIHSAMPTAQALRLCPQAVLLPPRHSLYRDYSRRVMAILHETAPLVEKVSIDEAYLDLSECVGEWGEVVEIARRLQRRVADEVRLSASLGVATNKLLAKVASDHDKPGGLTIVLPGTEAAFLAPLPVRVLWGIGPVTAHKLAECGVTTVGELAGVQLEELRARFGRHGEEMARQARGLDDRPVVAEHETQSVSQECTFARDLRDDCHVRAELRRLSQGVVQQLHEMGLVAGTVAVKLRYADFTTLTRQMRLAVPTDDERIIYRAVVTLYRRAWDGRRPLRLLGVAARQLSPQLGQLSLF